MTMKSKNLKPGENSGKDGGIYQEIGPRGGHRNNFTTIKDNTKAPPTSKPNSLWKSIKRTPDSKRP